MSSFKIIGLLDLFSEDEDFLKDLTIYGYDGILGHVARIIDTNHGCSKRNLALIGPAFSD